MGKMKMGAFGAPRGFYVGKFLGTTALTESKSGRDGKLMEPGLRWEWEITEDPDHDGAYVGVTVGRVTSQNPTAGNACGSLLLGVLDREKLDLNEEVDPDEMRGQSYRITIGSQRDNPEKTQVTAVQRIKTGSRAGVAPSGGPPSRPNGPPPRPSGPPIEKFWVDQGTGGEPPLLTRHEVEKWLETVKLEPATVAACQEGTTVWLTLKDFGFKALIPF